VRLSGPVLPPEEDPLAPARGCLFALLISGVFLFILAVILYLVLTLN